MNEASVKDMRRAQGEHTEGALPNLTELRLKKQRESIQAKKLSSSITKVKFCEVLFHPQCLEHCYCSYLVHRVIEH